MNTFYTLDPAALKGALGTFYDAIKTLIPLGTKIEVERAGDVIEDSTGKIIGDWTNAFVTVTDGSGVGAYAGPVGAVVTWHTQSIADGRRVRGRTFLVPLVASVYDLDGTLTNTALDVLQAAATGLVTSAPDILFVWHRPRAASLTKPARLGSSAAAISATVPDMAAVLRSRR